RTGFDPRALATPYRWFRISPLRVQAWREVNEVPDRELMRDGRWLVDASADGDREGGHAHRMETR
ncbi:MAG TPA: pyridoxamine 5'-phosphate oxidase family protein, partial [Candidatus Limnocylindria bacterium]|nr:pyridoxamine 5'-phosphate oxidase family protein [Candidatus Limnocylindria bacterium]